MNIHFYLDNEEQTPITSFYDMVSNPFKVGDEISLDVEELNPTKYANRQDLIAAGMLKDNKELINKFRLKDIVVLRENKYIYFNIVNEGKITIEYFCRFKTI
jgi:hypothetical protein